MATLSLKNINKIYPNNVQAVFDFNIDIKDKEFIVFVGPSGCGKSTTLRMVAGLEEITSGELLIDGDVMNHVAPKDRDIAMVFQNYALYPHMTVYENLKFALKLRKVWKPIYLPEPETKPLIAERKAIRKQISKLDRKFKKKQDASDLLVERAELYKELYANEDKYIGMLHQDTGIDYVQIKLLEKAKKSITKKLERDTAKLENISATIEANDEASIEIVAETVKEKAKLKHNAVYRRRQLKIVLNDAVEQSTRQLKDIDESIEYLSNNEVPLNKFRHLTNHEMDLEINKVSEAIDLIRYLYRKPAALSGGQRQRVALGRAIVRKPKVFLMDEPLSNLDAKLRVQTRSEISRIHKNVGATTIYVTHDQVEAMTMADRIVVMKDGYVQQIGTPDEVYNDPSNKFVASFIGSPSMNFIKGKIVKDHFVGIVVDKDGKGEIGVKKFSLELPAKTLKTLEAFKGKEIYLGIRPENLYVQGDKNNTKPSAPVKCDCEYSELLGYEFVLYTKICGQKVVLKTSVKNQIKTGDSMNIALDMNNLYFFDAETELRIK